MGAVWLAALKASVLEALNISMTEMKHKPINTAHSTASPLRYFFKIESIVVMFEIL